MSAFLMSPDDLAAIARAAAALPTPTPMDPEAIFNALLDENLKSVGYRYPHASTIADWFDDGEALFTWERTPESAHTATELRDLVKSYQYQSCEHPAWADSAVRKITDLLLIAVQPLADAEQEAEVAKQVERERALAKLPTLHGKETAVVFRKLLKANFPACKFSVRSDYNSVNVRWTDGPTEKQVKAVLSGFEAGHFDGMDDSYHYDRSSVVMVDGTAYRPGVQYVFTNRHTSAALARRAAAQIADYFGIPAPTIIDQGTYWNVDEANRSNPEVRQATGEDWGILIHRACEDRTRYLRESLTNAPEAK